MPDAGFRDVVHRAPCRSQKQVIIGAAARRVKEPRAQVGGPMCRTERQLIASLEHSEGKNAFQKLCNLCPPIRKFSSISEFITHLHTADGNSERHRSNDQLLSALFQALAGNQSDSVLQAILILAFIPALHRTSRDVFYLFPSLYEQDICQQVLATFSACLCHPAFSEEPALCRLPSPEPCARSSFAGPLAAC